MTDITLSALARLDDGALSRAFAQALRESVDAEARRDAAIARSRAAYAEMRRRAAQPWLATPILRARATQ
jgi:hypothetical protein